MSIYFGLEQMKFRLRQEDWLESGTHETEVWVDVQLEFSDSIPQLSPKPDTLFELCKSGLDVEGVDWKFRLENMVQKIVGFYNQCKSIELTVKCLYPTFGKEVQAATYRLQRNFEKKCPKCGKSFFCYNSSFCACSTIKISTATMTSLHKQYTGCLCTECLKSFA